MVFCIISEENINGQEKNDIICIFNYITPQNRCYIENYYATMIPISLDIDTLYNALLIQKAVPVKFHSSYRKWLRYYLDFCQKYGFRQSDTKSLPHFIKKLKEKKQTDQQQKQAVDAISIYYGEETIRENKNVVSKTNNKIISSKKDNLKPMNANYDTRTIQELMGHSDVRTTMIYTHTIKSRTIKEAKSPLDLP